MHNLSLTRRRNTVPSSEIGWPAWFTLPILKKILPLSFLFSLSLFFLPPPITCKNHNKTLSSSSLTLSSLFTGQNLRLKPRFAGNVTWKP
ncbi:hypothetical protein L2E82_31016 [Cichorium intybus]|uniref:Uncharacterized protein n=1 Tax=Cichorium intybus TaxID=13427 RepID=A0ACB9D258_CICIN|nr:hypothetical protein L2E82_31016 [Cichorium intybus]